MRYTLLELQVAHIKGLFNDVAQPVSHTYPAYVWQPLPVPINGQVQRAIAAYTA